MADSDSTNQVHTSNYQRGALAVLEAANQMSQIVAGDSEQTTTEYFAKIDAGIAALLSVAGPMPEKAAGAMAALAAYVVFAEQEGGLPSIANGWLPPAAMTSKELEEYRVRFAAECDGLKEVAA